MERFDIVLGAAAIADTGGRDGHIVGCTGRAHLHIWEVLEEVEDLGSRHSAEYS
jgi:hypothetical protein